MRDERSEDDLRLVVVSNRGPFEHHLRPDNRIEVRRASGGLVTALSAFRKHNDFHWIACAVTAGDRRAVREAVRRRDNYTTSRHLSGNPEPDSWAHSNDPFLHTTELVAVPKNIFRKYYEVFSNRALWFLQHSMWDRLDTPKDKTTVSDAWWAGYVPTNLALARAAAARARKLESRVLMLHDYHLYLAPGYIRLHLPDVVLQHFIHVPWPEPEDWEPLPPPMLRAICRGLLSNDIIGFQTSTSVCNFLRSCDAWLDDAEVDYTRNTVQLRGRIVRVRAYPISIDVAGLRRAMDLPAFSQHQEHLRRLCGDRTVVRVDRLDPSKNIALGFRAFEQLLIERPELRGKVKFLAFLVPSRTGVREYVQCHEEIVSLVNSINDRYSVGEHRPIELFYENNYHQALAGMSLCDVLLVNPLADGMNLVAKEGPIVSTRDSVLVLSRKAGAFAQLAGGALAIDPKDIGGTARALAKALDMSPEERRERARFLRARIENESIFHWVERQLDDIHLILSESSEQSQKQTKSGILSGFRFRVSSRSPRGLRGCRRPPLNLRTQT